MNNEQKERGKYTPTPKMLEFFMDTSREYLMEECKGEVSIASEKGPVGQFEHLCNKMLNSEDPTIKIEFSRCLMYMGFDKLLGAISESISTIMRSGLKDLMKDKVSGSLEDPLKGLLGG